MHRSLRLLTLPLLASLLTACSEPGPTPEASTGKTPYIVAVNRPLAWFAEQLLGGRVEVVMPAPAGTDPARWRPDADDVGLLQEAELVLLNGADYSPWLKHVSLSASRLVVTSEANRAQWIPLQSQVTHSHGPEGEHAHSGYAFTTWMNLDLAAGQARAVAAALQSNLPAQAGNIEANATALLQELAAMDDSYAEAVAPLRGRQVIYSHPVYQYFEARYQLPGISLHWEPDDMPGDAQWRELESSLEEDALFVWESEPLPRIAERLSALGVEQVTVDPGANADRDWMQLQRDNS